jgi:hypothetical protein
MQPERQTNELLVSALELADLGMSVIPLWWPIGATCACPKGADCNSAAKHPLTMNGLKDATLDANVIKTWWAKWPSANVGLCTGTEIDVIDVDGAIAEYNQLTRDNGIPEHVATVVTGRGEGGIHVYCTPGGNKTIPSGKHGLPEKIEVKGVGGYVVAPPSRHVSGGTYTYMKRIDGDIAGQIPLDQWLSKLEKPPAPVVPIRALHSTDNVSTANVQAYRDAVIRAACEAITTTSSGGRWMALATVAVPKIARGIAGGLIERSVGLYALHNATAQSGLETDELARIPALVDIMLSQGINEPIYPPADTNAAADLWLASLPKDDAGALPEEYQVIVAEIAELTPYERAVRAKFTDLRINDDAKAMLSTLKVGQAPALLGDNLSDFLAEVEEDEQYRVTDLWPSQGRVLLAAQAKSGKTTMVAANLLPSLVDGGLFLGRYEVTQVTRRVVYFNMEVGTRTMRRWLKEANIGAPGKITVSNLRGKASALSLSSQAGRTQFGSWLAHNDAEVVILDPLAPLLASLGLDENSNADVATFFAWWSESLMLGGVVDDLVVHHAGHGGERSRGASRLLDEPDAIWTLTKDADVAQESDDIYGAGSPIRYLSAYGRDVELPPEALSFVSENRQLLLTGLSRSAMKSNVDTQQIVDLFADGVPRSRNVIAQSVKGNGQKVWDLIALMIENGQLEKVGKTPNGYPLLMSTTSLEGE